MSLVAPVYAWPYFWRDDATYRVDCADSYVDVSEDALVDCD